MACPDGMVERAPGQLLCYDYNLSLRLRLPLGLSSVYGARAFVEGDRAVFWILGTPSPPPGSARSPQLQRSSLGVRVELGASGPQVSPLFAATLNKERETTLGTPGRELLESGSWVVVPFLGGEGPPPVRVLLRQGEGESSGEHAPPVWHFFTAHLSHAGLEDLRPVPLRVEPLGEETRVEEGEGLVRIPQGSRIFEVQAFSMAGNNWWMFLIFHASGKGKPQ